MQARAEKEGHKIRTFGEALRVLRIKASMSCHQVAAHTGVHGSLVRDWEKQERTPSPLHLKKLYDLLPDLKYFTDFLPRMLTEQMKTRAYAAGEEGRCLWVPPSPTPEEIPPPPDLVQISFGAALYVAMKDEELSPADMREVAGVSDVHVINLWTRNLALPDDKQYATLLDLFPALRDCPCPGEKDKTPPPDSIIPLAQIIPHPSSALPAEPEPPPPEPVVLQSVAPRVARRNRSPVDLAGVAHANALVAVQHAKLRLEEIRAEAIKLEEELVQLEQDVRESEQSLLDAVRRAAEEMS